MSETLKPEVLARYMNPVFIETGTYRGNGVLLAKASGFKRIISIELDPERMANARIALASIQGVELYEGDTLDILPKILAELEERATIFLDAHPIGAADTCMVGKRKWPLTEELRLIATNSKRKDHTLLIDDINEMVLFETSRDELDALVLAINPTYKLAVEPTFCGPVHMLAATVAEGDHL